MKRIVPALLCLLLIPALVPAFRIEVNVKGTVGGYIEYFEMKETTDSLQKFGLQWYNSQSANCKSRMEFRIYEDEYVESVWSSSKEMLPGVSDYFEAYWLPAKEGNYSVKIAIHHCQEIVESEPIDFFVESLPNSEDVITMEAKNLPDRKIEVILKSKRDVEDVVIVPSDYPIGWIFAGVKIGEIKEDVDAVAIVNYEPSVFRDESVTLQAVTLDGKYSSESVNFMVKEEKRFLDEHGLSVIFLIATGLIVSVLVNVYLIFKNKKAEKDRKL